MGGLGPLGAGRDWPLGATVDAHGINFAVFSAHAQRIELCLFDAAGHTELARLALPGHCHVVFHGHLAGAGPGLVYGLRAHGPWRPERGHRFNPAKLLLDPYARDVVGPFSWTPAHFGADAEHPSHPDPRDNARQAWKARVPDPRWDWADDTPPLVPPEDTVLYELHVKGFTRLHPGVPEAQRGTYAGLASDAAIAHLKGLGVTSLSLLPVHLHIDEWRLHQAGLANYWGYNTAGFFCPHPGLASAGAAPVDEFRRMVRALHRAGIEVLLDVVYNHSAESDEFGPTIHFRGLDNASYYRLPPTSRAHYENQAGCGNTLDLRQPRVLQLVMDSLRYWTEEMHVDGFRFDLAPVLGRGDAGFNRQAPLFTAIAQDPVLARVKLIAEPWDLGDEGYRLGGFPNGWGEWNDRFRDTMRGFWVRGDGTRGNFAQRLAGSADIFQPRGRAPLESVNYVVSHDGFTLADLVSHDRRHNLANGENNRDGHGHNLSWNCGVEGPSDDATVLDLRGRIRRALIATTLLAQGTPMLAAGDEFGHSQGGNNNPYCQDNATTWIDWGRVDADLLAFTTRVLALRHELQPLAPRWYDGLADRHGLTDLHWLRHDGTALTGDDWQAEDDRVLACLIGTPGRAATPLLLLVNGSAALRGFVLPAGRWHGLLDTGDPLGDCRWSGPSPTTLEVGPRSLMLLAAVGHTPR